MARKSGDQRSGKERRAAPRGNRRAIKREDDTTQLVERGEGLTAEEQIDPSVESPGEVVTKGGPAAAGASDRFGGETSGRGGAGSRGMRGTWRKSDESLRQEIREILTADPELEATDIEVEVEGGAVTLRGAVVDSDGRLLAEELVESLAGVREVHNRLRVERQED